MDRTNLTQRQRACALLVNVSIAMIVQRLVSGRWTITGDTSDAWLIGLIAFWLLRLISAPYFLPPKDSFGNGLGALIALSSIGLSPSAGFLPFVVKLVGMLMCLLVILLAVIAIAANAHHRESFVSKFAYRTSSEIGRGQILFTPVVLVSVFAGYAGNTAASLSITALWSLSITLGLFEFVITLYVEFWKIGSQEANDSLMGRIERFENPGLVRVLLSPTAKWDSASTCVLELPDGRQVIVLPVFEHPAVEGRIGTALIAEDVSDYLPHVRELEVHVLGGTEARQASLCKLSGTSEVHSLAGFVVERASIGTLRFEALDSSLEKGCLVFICSNSARIFYQIIDAETAEEALSSQLWGRRVATAVQLGEYVANVGFKRYDWVPAMNAGVFRVPEDAKFEYDQKQDQFSVGFLPRTQCPIFADVNEIVHYHAAILGVTGTGKTELSLDTVRAAVERGCKVVCVDFTGEYAKRLADLKPVQLGLAADLGKKYEQAIFAVETGAYGAGQEKAALKKLVDEIGPLVSGQVEKFLEDGPSLAILELAEITNTKASLRTTELFLSAFMTWAKANRRKKRILLVLEEAHTIVPETGGSGMDHDSKWVVDRIGQIALQGRKYGIGLLVVSQRTALVSKTILSQCNSFFVFSLVDQTSLGFLTSVLSTEHVHGIPNLQKLELICYGRAISSDRPIIARRAFDENKAKEAALLDSRP